MAPAGESREILFADLLQFYCLSGQTAAVSVTAPDGLGRASSGTFFIDGGVLVDARYDGSEGADAVRRAVRQLKTGAFQVELGARSERRTIHEPWSALVRDELRQPDRPPRIEPVVRSPISLPRLPASEHPTPPAGVPATRDPAAWEGAGVALPRARSRTVPSAASPGTVPAAREERRPVPGVPPRAPAGPSKTPPRPVALEPAPPTEPFPRLDRFSLRPGMRRLLAVGAALVTGGVLAVVTARFVGDEPGTFAPRTPAAAMAGAPAGVTDSEVTFGMAAPLTGASRELGRQMKLGLETAFAAANAEGGVHGRRVRLLVLDDGFEPARTARVMRELAEEHGVFGFAGNVGSPSVAVPYALGRQMLFFGPFSGSPLKEPPEHTVFTYRASHREEAAAIVRYLLQVRRIRPDQIAVLAEDDAYGEAGYQGVVAALRRSARDLPPVPRVTYQRNTADVSSAVARVVERGDRTRAVILVATYRAAARFIEQVKNQRPSMLFATVSLVGSTALADELMQLGPRFAAGVIVTQVVPLPTSRSSAVLRYQDALAAYAPGEKPDFVSLEGYVVGNLLLEGLRRSGRTVSTENMVRALETIRGLDLGLGTTVGFGPADHQGSHRVWGTVLDASGTYQPIDLE